MWGMLHTKSRDVAETEPERRCYRTALMPCGERLHWCVPSVYCGHGRKECDQKSVMVERQKREKRLLKTVPRAVCYFMECPSTAADRAVDRMRMASHNQMRLLVFGPHFHCVISCIGDARTLGDALVEVEHVQVAGGGTFGQGQRPQPQARPSSASITCSRVRGIYTHVAFC